MCWQKCSDIKITYLALCYAEGILFPEGKRCCSNGVSMII